ncbi:hypothetical protein F4805DRAFT_214085 [Annulohypoxylon moriforme]|nr:hypothetical protein F4805DRAFT_214085 [Annulohypoxylon moriforme]
MQVTPSDLAYILLTIKEMGHFKLDQTVYTADNLYCIPEYYFRAANFELDGYQPEEEIHWFPKGHNRIAAFQQQYSRSAACFEFVGWFTVKEVLVVFPGSTIIDGVLNSKYRYENANGEVIARQHSQSDLQKTWAVVTFEKVEGSDLLGPPQISTGTYQRDGVNNSQSSLIEPRAQSQHFNTESNDGRHSQGGESSTQYLYPPYQPPRGQGQEVDPLHGPTGDHPAFSSTNWQGPFGRGAAGGPPRTYDASEHQTFANPQQQDQAYPQHVNPQGTYDLGMNQLLPQAQDEPVVPDQPAGAWHDAFNDVYMGFENTEGHDTPDY